MPDNTNRNFIRVALREAISLLGARYSNINFILDEATREEAGSPNIPMTILQKVRQSDIFICDITTINSSANEKNKRVPNPNVVFELGYAVSHLGWNRIIMIFNTAFGTFPDDAPFDIDRHRISRYNCSKGINKNESEKKKDGLIKLLFTALSTIITKAPIRADLEYMSVDEKKRRDLRNLKSILSSINLSIIDRHVDEAPIRIYSEIFHFWSSFHGIYSSSSFYFYDQILRREFKKFHDAWDKSLSYGSYYYDSRKSGVFIFVPSYRVGEEEEDAYQTIFKSVEKMKKAFNVILNYIRENYPEINIEDLSKTALQEYIEYNKKLDKYYKSKRRKTQNE